MFNRKVISFYYIHSSIINYVNSIDWFLIGYYGAIALLAVVFYKKFKDRKAFAFFSILFKSAVAIIMLEIVTQFGLIHVFHIIPVIDMETNFSDIYFDIFAVATIFLLLKAGFRRQSLSALSRSTFAKKLKEAKFIKFTAKKLKPMVRVIHNQLEKLNIVLGILLITAAILLINDFFEYIFIPEKWKAIILAGLTTFLFALYKILRGKKAVDDGANKDKDNDKKESFFFDRFLKNPFLTLLLIALMIPTVEAIITSIEKSYHLQLEKLIPDGEYVDEYLQIRSKDKSRLFRRQNPIFIDYADDKSTHIISDTNFKKIKENLDKKPILFCIPSEIKCDLAVRELAYKLHKEKKIVFITSDLRFGTREEKEKIAQLLNDTEAVLLVNNFHSYKEDRAKLLNAVDNRVICVEQFNVMPKYVERKLVKQRAANKKVLKKYTPTAGKKEEEKILKISISNTGYEIYSEKGKESAYHNYDDLRFLVAIFNKYNLFVRKSFVEGILDKSLDESDFERILSFPRNNNISSSRKENTFRSRLEFCILSTCCRGCIEKTPGVSPIVGFL